MCNTTLEFFFIPARVSRHYASHQPAKILKVGKSFLSSNYSVYELNELN